MNDDSTRAELAQLRARVAQLETKQRSQPHVRHTVRRFFPLAIVGLLVALMPLSILAAPVFSDLGTAAPVHQPNIQAIGDAGITTGFEDPADPTKRLYNPKDLVTREEMASFLARTAGLGTNPPVTNAKTLDGRAPNALIRSAAVEANVTTALTGTTTTLLTAPITAPTAGYLLVTVHYTYIAGVAGPRVHCGLDVDTTGEAWISTRVATSTVDITAATDRAVCNISHRFAVAAGDHLVRYKAHNDGVAGLDGGGGSMEVHFVPFDANGAAAAETPPAAPASGGDIEKP
jgi:hypothetical protein